MTGVDLMSLLSDISTVSTGIAAVAGAIIAAVSSRNKVNDKLLEIIKTGDLRQAERRLAEDGNLSNVQLYEIHNFLSVVEKANHRVNHKNTGERHYSSFDWFMRFYEAVGKVSDEDMQELWSRILAGEINRPSTYSIRTVETLKNMDRREAELFRFLAPHLISSMDKSRFLPNSSMYLRHYEIKYADIMELSEAGLIYMEGALNSEIEVSQKGKPFFINQNTIIDIASTNKGNDKVKIKKFPLTKAGMEIYSLLETETTSESFLLFCNEINKQEGVVASVCELIKKDGDLYTYKK